MSNVPPQNPPAATPAHAAAVAETPETEIIIISHSNLFYWWPVWAVGFLMGLLTWFGGYVMAVVPDDSTHKPVAKRDWKVVITNDKGKLETEMEGVLLEEKSDKPKRGGLPANIKDPDKPEQPHLHISASKAYGVVFTFVLLLVIVITNVPLRGMRSLLVIMLVVMMSLIFALADLWKPLLELMSRLDIRMTMGGYFMIAGMLFVCWLFTFMIFDRQVYMRFTPGQVKVCTEVGGGEKVYDATGMTLEKQRSDLFRHWILGLGSGDLVVRTSGAQAHQFDLPNVLFIGRKVAQIEDMLKKKSVVESK